MLPSKKAAHVDRVLLAAAFTFIALVIGFARPGSHSSRLGNSIAAVSSPAKRVPAGKVDNEVASTGVLFTEPGAPSPSFGHSE